MDKKQLYYVIGGVAVIGISIGLYFYNKNKNVEGDVEMADLKTKSAEETTDGVKNEKVPMPKPAPAPVTATSISPVIKLTEQQLEDKLSSCGKKPKLKKNLKLYHACRGKIADKLRSQGLIAYSSKFDGSYSFEGLLDNDFFSGFDSNFDLNI